MDGTLVLNPKYLQIEDVLDEYIEILPEKLRNIYVEGIHYTRKGCQPIPCLEGGKRAGFYAVLVKKAWLRKMKVFTPDSKWRSEDLPGFSGFYLAEGPSQACRYAVEEYGYPLKSLVAIVIGRVMSGDFSYLKLIKEM